MKRLLCLVFMLFVSTKQFYVNAQITPAQRKFIEFIISPDKKDWIYHINEDAKIEIRVLKNGISIDAVDIHYELGPEMLSSIQNGNVTTKNGIAILNIGTCKNPGFKQCKFNVTIEGCEYSDQIKVAYSPLDIKSSVFLPEDFMTFWDKVLKMNASIPLEARTTYLQQYSTSTVDVYLVRFQNSKKGEYLYGYLCKPKKEGPFPGIVIYPGAGVKSQVPNTSYADQGFISLSIEIHGISPLLDDEVYQDINNALGNYMFNGLESPDRYYYKHVYAGCVKAIDLLCSQPEYDGENLAVTGGSQGGALAIVAASLDKRVRCLAAFYPAMCDFTGYLNGRAGGWPHIFSGQNKEVMDKPGIVNTLAYFDIANFARFIHVPGFYSWGFNDNTCPPTATYSAINNITASKTIVITPISGHWRFPESNKKSFSWIKAQFHMK